MGHGEQGGAQPVVRIEAGRKVLRVGGVIQSVAVDETYQQDVWDAMLPRTQPANMLILGLGGGTIASLATQRWGPLPIVGVERDPAVAWLAQHEFGLVHAPHVHVIVADAFTYLRDCREHFDAIAVDLYVAGKMAHGVLGSGFLRDTARTLTPTGTVSFNLWRGPYVADALRRLSRLLAILAITEAEDNIVVCCGRGYL